MPRFAVQIPYVAFAVSYTLMFVFAFSAVSNFGILTRQRTQVLPVRLVLIAVPRIGPWSPNRATDRPRW